MAHIKVTFLLIHERGHPSGTAMEKATLTTPSGMPYQLNMDFITVMHILGMTDCEVVIFSLMTSGYLEMQSKMMKLFLLNRSAPVLHQAWIL